MIARLKENLDFAFYYTSDTQPPVGKTGLTVTVDVYGPSLTKIKNSVSATEIGGGLYTYRLLASEVTSYGKYYAIASTTSNEVSVKHVPDAWIVSPWVDNIIATASRVESPYGTELDETLGGLRLMLRRRLNDLDMGNYTTAELDYCINLAKRETELTAKCHIVEKQIAVNGAVLEIRTEPGTAGSGYKVGDVLTISGGGAYKAKVEVVSVNSGAVTKLMLLESGSGYTTGVNVSTTGGSGSGCKVDILSVMKPGMVSSVKYIPTTGGSGYSVGAVLTLSNGGSESGCTVEVASVSGSGAVTAVRLLTAGQNYSAGTEYNTTSSGGGSGCKVTVLSVAPMLEEGCGVYSIYPIFEPISCSYNGKSMDYMELSGASLYSGNMQMEPSGEPKRWSFMTGSKIVVSPPPFASGALTVTGYAFSGDLLADSDVCTTIPAGYRVSVILDRAEAEACKMRRTSANNASMYIQLMEEWKKWCERIKESARGEGR